MLRVGLTVPAGSGKTTVAQGLARRGLPVMDADRIAHELYAPGSVVVGELVRAFGPDILAPDGGIDRTRLGRMVFGSGERLATLNRIVHPPLLREVRRRLEVLEEEGNAVAVVEAALLLQWEPLDFVDLVIGVTAPRALRKARLVAGGLSPEAAELRLDAQVDPGELERKSDILVRNEGDREDLEWRVEALARELLRRSSP